MHPSARADAVTARPPFALSAAELTRLRSRLLRHARRLVGDRDVAEDLVQETLIGVVKGRAACRGESSLDTWASAILRHKVADWYRTDDALRDANRSVCIHETDSADAADADPADKEQPGSYTCATPDRELERRQLASAIDAGLARLPARSRQVFAMHEQLGFDTGEVCQRLGISAPHCRELLHRARLALRGQLLARSFAPSSR